MASQPGLFNFQAFTNLGDLGDGMRLYTYAPSTTTHKVAYTDVSGLIPHTYTNDGSGGQYIALDARGELPAPLFLTSGGYDLALKTPAGATVWTRRTYGTNDRADDLRTDLANTASQTLGAALVGYNSALSYAAGNVGFELNKRRSVVATGVAATDVAAIQAAVNAAGDYETIEFFGNFATNSTITLKPKLKLVFRNATVTHSNNAADLFAYTPGTPTGFPGRIVIEGLRAIGPGNSGSAFAVKVDANAPFCVFRNCYISGFFGGVYLRDAYASAFEHCYVVTVSHGVQLHRESHAVTLLNCGLDACTVAALSINYNGGAGPTHNINVIGGYYQNSAVGVWAENCLGLHTKGLYHEGNTVNDYRIGVADAGVYARAAYNTVIDGFESSSACAGDRNIRIEHAVGVEVRGAAWNSGCSTTATLLSYDGFSDRVSVDVHRYTTATPTATAPVDFTGDTTRGVLWYKGRPVFGAGMTDAIQFGTLAATLGSLYQGTTPGGRNAITLRSHDKDLQIRAPELIRLQDGSGNDYVQVDALNGKVVIARPLAHTGASVGFYSTTPIAKPTVSGSRDANAALQSLLTQLAALGLITDSTSA